MHIVVAHLDEAITRVTFFSEEGIVQVVLTESSPCDELFDVTVVEGKSTGRALFFQKKGESDVSFSAYDNLALVLRWVRQCNHHLRLLL
jgi:hypothetical protein